MPQQQVRHETGYEKRDNRHLPLVSGSARRPASPMDRQNDERDEEWLEEGPEVARRFAAVTRSDISSYQRSDDTPLLRDRLQDTRG